MAGVRKKPKSSGKYQGWFIDYKGDRKFFIGTKRKSETLRMAENLRMIIGRFVQDTGPSLKKLINTKTNTSLVLSMNISLGENHKVVEAENHGEKNT